MDGSLLRRSVAEVSANAWPAGAAGGASCSARFAASFAQGSRQQRSGGRPETPELRVDRRGSQRSRCRLLVHQRHPGSALRAPRSLVQEFCRCLVSPQSPLGARRCARPATMRFGATPRAAPKHSCSDCGSKRSRVRVPPADQRRHQASVAPNSDYLGIAMPCQCRPVLRSRIQEVQRGPLDGSSELDRLR